MSVLVMLCLITPQFWTARFKADGKDIVGVLRETEVGFKFICEDYECDNTILLTREPPEEKVTSRSKKSRGRVKGARNPRRGRSGSSSSFGRGKTTRNTTAAVVHTTGMRRSRRNQRVSEVRETAETAPISDSLHSSPSPKEPTTDQRMDRVKPQGSHEPTTQRPPFQAINETIERLNPEVNVHTTDVDDIVDSGIAWLYHDLASSAVRKTSKPADPIGKETPNPCKKPPEQGLDHVPASKDLDNLVFNEDGTSHDTGESAMDKLSASPAADVEPDDRASSLLAGEMHCSTHTTTAGVTQKRKSASSPISRPSKLPRIDPPTAYEQSFMGKWLDTQSFLQGIAHIEHLSDAQPTRSIGRAGLRDVYHQPNLARGSEQATLSVSNNATPAYSDRTEGESIYVSHTFCDSEAYAASQSSVQEHDDLYTITPEVDERRAQAERTRSYQPAAQRPLTPAVDSAPIDTAEINNSSPEVGEKTSTLPTVPSSTIRWHRQALASPSHDQHLGNITLVLHHSGLQAFGTLSGCSSAQIFFTSSIAEFDGRVDATNIRQAILTFESPPRIIVRRGHHEDFAWDRVLRRIKELPHTVKEIEVDIS